MNIVQAFRGEHAVFLALFDHLEGSIPVVTEITQVKSMGGMLASALISHALLEEELLFDPLEAYESSSESLEAMREEHRRIDRRIERVVGLIPTMQKMAFARRLVLQIIEVTREHFTKEEMELFPMAELVMENDTLTHLGSLWAEKRNIFLPNEEV